MKKIQFVGISLVTLVILGLSGCGGSSSSSSSDTSTSDGSSTQSGTFVYYQIFYKHLMINLEI